MKQHLLISLTLVFVAAITQGCRSSRHEAVLGPIPVNSFAKVWQADLKLRGDAVKSLNVRDNTLIVYTDDNKGYWLGASGGELQAVNQIANEGHTLHPPVALTDHIVIPTTVSIEMFDKAGRHVDSITTPSALQSPGAGAGNSIFVGVSHAGSGRLARLDVTDKLSLAWEMYTTDGIVAAPAVIGDAVYAGGIDGRVWAVTLQRIGLWSLPGSSFQTDGPITADLAVDDFGVYVASHDKKLYCLDRTSGRIKWTYYSGMPLTERPIVIGNFVYQQVPGRGLAAINKTEGATAREAMWVQQRARQVLAADDRYIYVRTGDKRILALDLATGEPAFENARDDLSVFATNLTSPIVYAATREGTILAIEPVLRPGNVGEIVFSDTILPAPVALAQ